MSATQIRGTLSWSIPNVYPDDSPFPHGRIEAVRVLSKFENDPNPPAVVADLAGAQTSVETQMFPGRRLIYIELTQTPAFTGAAKRTSLYEQLVDIQAAPPMNTDWPDPPQASSIVWTPI